MWKDWNAACPELSTLPGSFRPQNSRFLSTLLITYILRLIENSLE
ncbi:hypothetical protein LEMLEM_LOCUS24705, partial [Lemmus lemmus]